MSTVLTATLSFDLVTNALSHNSDEFTVEISTDGGSSYPHVITTIDKDTPTGTMVSSELVASIGPLTANNRIRIRLSNTGGSSSNYSEFDNVSIAYTTSNSCAAQAPIITKN